MNRETGDVIIEANGRSYTLRFDFNAMCTLEGHYSTAAGHEVLLPQIMERMLAGGVTYIRAFIWAALRRHHEDLTLADAGDIVHGAGGLPGLQQQLNALTASARADAADLEALGAVVPAKGKNKHARPTKAGGGTGAASTSPHAAAG